MERARKYARARHAEWCFVEAGGSSRRARSPLVRLALPVVVAAPSGGARPRLWRPGARLRAYAVALAVGLPPALLRLCGAPPRGRALWPSRVAVLGRARAVAASGSASPRLGPLRRACARPPRASGSLRAALRPAPLVALAPLRAPGGRPALWSGSRRASAASAGPPCLAARAAVLLAGRSSPRGGSRPAARASGGCVPRPRAAGACSVRAVLRSSGLCCAPRGRVPDLGQQSRPSKRANGPDLDSGPIRGHGKLRQFRKKRTAVLHFWS